MNSNKRCSSSSSSSSSPSPKKQCVAQSISTEDLVSPILTGNSLIGTHLHRYKYSNTDKIIRQYIAPKLNYSYLLVNGSSRIWEYLCMISATHAILNSDPNTGTKVKTLNGFFRSHRLLKTSAQLPARVLGVCGFRTFKAALHKMYNGFSTIMCLTIPTGGFPTSPIVLSESQQALVDHISSVFGSLKTLTVNDSHKPAYFEIGADCVPELGLCKEFVFDYDNDTIKIFFKVNIKCVEDLFQANYDIDGDKLQGIFDCLPINVLVEGIPTTLNVQCIDIGISSLMEDLVLDTYLKPLSGLDSTYYVFGMISDENPGNLEVRFKQEWNLNMFNILQRDTDLFCSQFAHEIMSNTPGSYVQNAPTLTLPRNIPLNNTDLIDADISPSSMDIDSVADVVSSTDVSLLDVCFLNTDSDKICCISSDGDCRIISLKLGLVVTSFTHGVNLSRFCLSSNDKYLLTSGGSNVRLWDVSTGAPLDLWRYNMPSKVIIPICFTPNGEYFAMLDHREKMSWQTSAIVMENKQPTCSVKGTFNGRHSNHIKSIVYSPNIYDGLFFSSSDDTLIHSWDIYGAHNETFRDEHKLGVHSIDVSKDGNCLMSGSLDMKVVYWDTRTADKIREVKMPSPIKKVKFTNNGLNSIIHTHALCYMLAPPSRTQQILGTLNVCNTLSISPDGLSLVSFLSGDRSPVDKRNEILVYDTPHILKYYLGSYATPLPYSNYPDQMKDSAILNKHCVDLYNMSLVFKNNIQDQLRIKADKFHHEICLLLGIEYKRSISINVNNEIQLFLDRMAKHLRDIDTHEHNIVDITIDSPNSAKHCISEGKLRDEARAKYIDMRKIITKNGVLGLLIRECAKIQVPLDEEASLLGLYDSVKDLNVWDNSSLIKPSTFIEFFNNFAAAQEEMLLHPMDRELSVKTSNIMHCTPNAKEFILKVKLYIDYSSDIKRIYPALIAVLDGLRQSMVFSSTDPNIIKWNLQSTLSDTVLHIKFLQSKILSLKASNASDHVSLIAKHAREICAKWLNLTKLCNYDGMPVFKDFSHECLYYSDGMVLSAMQAPEPPVIDTIRLCPYYHDFPIVTLGSADISLGDKLNNDSYTMKYEGSYKNKDICFRMVNRGLPDSPSRDTLSYISMLNVLSTTDCGAYVSNHIINTDPDVFTWNTLKLGVGAGHYTSHNGTLREFLLKYTETNDALYTRMIGQLVQGMNKLHTAKPFKLFHGDFSLDSITVNESFNVGIIDIGLSILYGKHPYVEGVTEVEYINNGVKGDIPCLIQVIEVLRSRISCVDMKAKLQELIQMCPSTLTGILSALDITYPTPFFVDVHYGSTEFQLCQTLMNKPTPKMFTVHKVTRIIDEDRENLYNAEKGNLKSDDNNEFMLFHGTRKTPPKIVINSRYGLTKNYASTGFFGKGLYFAQNAPYVNGVYSHKIDNDAKKNKQLLMCNVLCGDMYHAGAEVDREFDIEELDDEYDSVVSDPLLGNQALDGKNSSKVHVVFKDTQCLPKYIVEYNENLVFL